MTLPPILLRAFYRKIRNSQFLLRSNRACPYFSGPFVIDHDHTGRSSGAFYQCERCRHSTIVKQLFPFAQYYRMNIKPEFVHQIMLEQLLK